MMSILKTIDMIFGLPPLNQFDAAATDLAASFEDQPDFAPYDFVSSDTRVFNPAEARDPDFNWRSGRSLAPSAPLDDPTMIRKQLRVEGKNGSRRTTPAHR